MRCPWRPGRREWLRRATATNKFFGADGTEVQAMWRIIFSLLLVSAASAETEHPVLALGSPAPEFSLPGIDGKVHRLADYAASPVLVVVFTCNHCPIAQMYEQRIQKLETDYRDRGVA